MDRKTIPPGMYLLHFNSLQWFIVIYSNQTTKPKYIQHLTKHIQSNAQHFFYIIKTLVSYSNATNSLLGMCQSTALGFDSHGTLKHFAACRGNESSTSLLYPWAQLSTSIINIVKEWRDLRRVYSFLFFTLIVEHFYILWMQSYAYIEPLYVMMSSAST